MLKHSLKIYSPFITNVSGVFLQDMRSMCTTISKEKWDLFSAVCIERYPVITKPMNELEKKFHEMLQQVEYEHSLKCDFELRKEREIKQAELVKEGKVEIDMDTPVGQTAMDIEEIGVKELNEFQFGSRETEADTKNITTSLNRKLDQNLLLLMEQKVGSSNYWLPPQGLRNEGETLRQTAERVLKEACGDELRAKFFGNAPIGVYKYTYPKKLKEKQGTCGAKIFYYLAKHIQGNVQNKVKYQWLNRNEMKQLLPKEVYKSVSYFLIPE